MTARYALTAVLFWTGVVAVTLAGCWTVDKITQAWAGRREDRRAPISRPDRIPSQRTTR